MRSSPAARALREAQSVAAYARRTGCDLDEAAGALATGGGVSRRNVLRGAAAAAFAAAIPVGAAGIRPAAAAAGREPKVVIVGSGIAGLGCAFRLWKSSGVRSEVYEYNPARPGGRVHTLRGFFDGGQYSAEHGEFVSSEHTAMRRLAARLGLALDNVNAYPPHTRPDQYRFRFGGRFWPQAALNREWHEWGFRLFHDAAFRKAPWPTRYDKHTAWARRWDHTPASEWIEQHIPGGLRSDFGRLCVAVLLDEYGGPVAEQSALNLIYLLAYYDSAPSGSQPQTARSCLAPTRSGMSAEATTSSSRGSSPACPPGPSTWENAWRRCAAAATAGTRARFPAAPAPGT